MFEKQIPFNFYYSLARYSNGIPNQTFNLSLRDNSGWVSSHYKEMIEYDFLIDVDSGDHSDIEYAWDSTKDIINYFDLLQVPYELRFSGMGFHIIVPYVYFPKYSFNPKDNDNIYTLYSRIAKMLKERFSEMLDTTIYDSRRVCKLPFSLSIYEDGVYVCTPFLSRLDFDNFNLFNYRVDTVPCEDITISKENRKIFNPEGHIKHLLSDLERFEKNG
jgi:hypothetical protein